MPERLEELASQREAIRLKRLREGSASLLSEQRSIRDGNFARYAGKYIRDVFETDDRLVVLDEEQEPVAVVLSPAEYELLCQFERAHLKR